MDSNEPDKDDKMKEIEPEKDLEENQEKLKYPRSIPFIVVNEFCERFNYYGMRTVLVLYLTRKLFYDEDTATVIYHSFTSLVFFMCIFGAIIADSWWGKFKTILILSAVYTVGSVFIAVGAIEPLNLPAAELTLIGLFVIAVGSGGIKPCVSAFGGEQFKMPQQAKQLALFFSMFYFAVNSGSFISTSVTPILREDVKCFGADDCFPLAFGVPAILMIISILVFIFGKFLYVINPLSGNMLVKVFGCITHAISTKSKEKKTNPQEHWLDYAKPKYGKKLVLETKILLNVLVLYTVLPVFWALFEQQGSRWTFQATRMDGDIGFMKIKPDQMHVLNPFMILVFIPLYEVAFYPILSKIGIRRPLQKLVLGGTYAGIAFLLSAGVEIALEPGYAVLPTEGQSHLRIYNGMSCDYSFQNSQTEFEVNELGLYEHKDIWLNENNFSQPFTIKSKSSACPDFEGQFKFEFESKTSISYFLRLNSDKMEISRFHDNPSKSRNGFPVVRILANIISNENITIREGDTVRYNETKLNTDTRNMPDTTYDIFIGDEKVFDERFKLGGVYAVIIRETSDGKFDKATKIITEPNSLSMLWQIPQYVVMTLGEVMYSVTGLQFAFTQAPESMKSVVMGSWNLTVAFGNLIVILVAGINSGLSQTEEFFLFAGIMFADMMIFSYLAYRYKPIPIELLKDIDDESEPLDDQKKKSPLEFENGGFDKKEE